MSKKYTLEEITRSIFDGKHGDCEDQIGSKLYFISVKDLSEHDIIYDNAREITKKDFISNYKRTCLEDGDTIYANTGDTIGKSVFVKNNPLVASTSFQKSVAVLKPNTNYVIPRYLYYLMKYETPRIRAAATGSGQKNLLLSTMRDFVVDVHDKIKQIQITGVLGVVDDKIQNNKKIIAELEDMAKTIYMHMFFRKKNNGKLAHLIIENAKSQIQVGEAKGSDGDYPFFTSGEAIYEWNEALVEGRNCFLNTGGNADIKFYVGKAAYSTDTWSITAKENFSDYLYMLLLTIKVELNSKYFQGTGLKHLQKELLRDRAIYIPNEEEIKYFNKMVVPAFDSITEKTRENQQLSDLRDWLLPMLMNGRATVE